MRIHKPIFSVVFTSLAILTAPNIAHTFTLSPMSVSFNLSGTPSDMRTTKTFFLDNDSDNNIAIELSIMTREIDIDGKETNNNGPEVEKLFQIYPPQLLLKPKEKRAVRLSWKGESNPKKELSFRLVAEQLPVRTEKTPAEKGKAVINMLLRYMAAIYITPAGAKPEIKITEAKATNSQNAGKISLVFENSGTAHGMLSDFQIEIRQAGAKAILKSFGLQQINGQNLLAGRARRFVIPWPSVIPRPWPASMPAGPIEAELKFSE
ncbi:MAG: fimbria/pilus periplasmic chaperone [Bdellovibrionota bacterium]|mgnify:CR=1 FL=1